MQKVKSIIPENIEVANEFDVNAPNVHFILNSLGHFFIWEKGKKYKWFLLPSAYNYIVKLAMSCFGSNPTRLEKKAAGIYTQW